MGGGSASGRREPSRLLSRREYAVTATCSGGWRCRTQTLMSRAEAMVIAEMAGTFEGLPRSDLQGARHRKQSSPP